MNHEYDIRYVVTEQENVLDDYNSESRALIVSEDRKISRFNNLIQEQLERLKKLKLTFQPPRKFVSSFSQTNSRNLEKESEDLRVLTLKSYVGRLSSILLAISDTVLIEKKIGTSNFNTAIMDKSGISKIIDISLQELEMDLSRYGKESIYSELQQRQHNLSELENEVKEILLSLKSHPASLLSKGDNGESIHAITESLQGKLTTLQQAALETGVLQGEAMFVSDLQNVICIVQRLSHDVQENYMETGIEDRSQQHQIAPPSEQVIYGSSAEQWGNDQISHLFGQDTDKEVLPGRTVKSSERNDLQETNDDNSVNLIQEAGQRQLRESAVNETIPGPSGNVMGTLLNPMQRETGVGYRSKAHQIIPASGQVIYTSFAEQWEEDAPSLLEQDADKEVFLSGHKVKTPERNYLQEAKDDSSINLIQEAGQRKLHEFDVKETKPVPYGNVMGNLIKTMPRETGIEDRSQQQQIAPNSRQAIHISDARSRLLGQYTDKEVLPGRRVQTLERNDLQETKADDPFNFMREAGQKQLQEFVVNETQPGPTGNVIGNLEKTMPRENIIEDRSQQNNITPTIGQVIYLSSAEQLANDATSRLLGSDTDKEVVSGHKVKPPERNEVQETKGDNSVNLIQEAGQRQQHRIDMNETKTPPGNVRRNFANTTPRDTDIEGHSQQYTIAPTSGQPIHISDTTSRLLGKYTDKEVVPGRTVNIPERNDLLQETKDDNSLFFMQKAGLRQLHEFDVKETKHGPSGNVMGNLVKPRETDFEDRSQQQEISPTNRQVIHISSTEEWENDATSRLLKQLKQDKDKAVLPCRKVKAPKRNGLQEKKDDNSLNLIQETELGTDNKVLPGRKERNLQETKDDNSLNLMQETGLRQLKKFDVNETKPGSSGNVLGHRVKRMPKYNVNKVLRIPKLSRRHKTNRAVDAPTFTSFPSYDNGGDTVGYENELKDGTANLNSLASKSNATKESNRPFPDDQTSATLSQSDTIGYTPERRNAQYAGFRPASQKPQEEAVEKMGSEKIKHTLPEKSFNKKGDLESDSSKVKENTSEFVYEVPNKIFRKHHFKLNGDSVRRGIVSAGEIPRHIYESFPEFKSNTFSHGFGKLSERPDRSRKQEKVSCTVPDADDILMGSPLNMNLMKIINLKYWRDKLDDIIQGTESLDSAPNLNTLELCEESLKPLTDDNKDVELSDKTPSYSNYYSAHAFLPGYDEHPTDRKDSIENEQEDDISSENQAQDETGGPKSTQQKSADEKVSANDRKDRDGKYLCFDDGGYNEYKVRSFEQAENNIHNLMSNESQKDSDAKQTLELTQNKEFEIKYIEKNTLKFHLKAKFGMIDSADLKSKGKATKKEQGDAGKELLDGERDGGQSVLKGCEIQSNGNLNIRNDKERMLSTQESMRKKTDGIILVPDEKESSSSDIMIGEADSMRVPSVLVTNVTPSHDEGCLTECPIVVDEKGHQHSTASQNNVIEMSYNRSLASTSSEHVVENQSDTLNWQIPDVTKDKSEIQNRNARKMPLQVITGHPETRSVATLPFRVCASKSDTSISKRKRKFSYPVSTSETKMSNMQVKEMPRKKRRYCRLLRGNCRQNMIFVLLIMLLQYLLRECLFSCPSSHPFMEEISKRMDLKYLTFPST